MIPNEFITSATQLLAGESEARFRSAVSRAYYGAFHLAKQFLSDCGVIIRTEAMAHRNVLWCLTHSDKQPINDAASLLGTLREARNDADYELLSKRFIRKAEARAEVQRAIEVVTLLAPYQSDAQRSRVAPAIKAYAATIGLPLRS